LREEIDMPSATVTSKGQITLPASLRAEQDIEVGDEIVFFTTLDGRPTYRVRRRSRAPFTPVPTPVTRLVTESELNDGIAEASMERLGLAKPRP
jgi:AbrB family looped-hinge helix DNA binding protein